MRKVDCFDCTCEMFVDVVKTTVSNCFRDRDVIAAGNILGELSQRREESQEKNDQERIGEGSHVQIGRYAQMTPGLRGVGDKSTEL